MENNIINLAWKREQRWADRRYTIADRQSLGIVNENHERRRQAEIKAKEEQEKANKPVAEKPKRKPWEVIKSFAYALHHTEFFGTVFGVCMACGCWMWTLDRKLDAVAMVVAAVLSRLIVEYFYDD